MIHIDVVVKVIESAQTTIVVYNLVDHKMVAVVKRIRVCQSRIQDHADLAPLHRNVFVLAQQLRHYLCSSWIQHLLYHSSIESRLVVT